tara:strand:- start:38 stop:280 length:243 start_codon:yes stop_codon:yes gene_type:complete
MNYQTQFDRQELIKEKCGICIVTCGRCGGVVLAKYEDAVDADGYGGHACPHCGFESDCCDFPDMYYEHDIDQEANKELNQ